MERLNVPQSKCLHHIGHINFPRGCVPMVNISTSGLFLEAYNKTVRCLSQLELERTILFTVWSYTIAVGLLAPVIAPALHSLETSN